MKNKTKYILGDRRGNLCWIEDDMSQRPLWLPVIYNSFFVFDFTNAKMIKNPCYFHLLEDECLFLKEILACMKIPKGTKIQFSSLIVGVKTKDLTIGIGI